jgi:peptidoglycan/LPS O-acetylase OafA/YrhL
LLKIIDKNGGKHPEPVWKIVLSRVLRISPLYLFMITFLWAIIPVFGGQGPRFY